MHCFHIDLTFLAAIFGIVALLLETIVLFGIPSSQSNSIRDINYLTATSGVDVIGIITNKLGLPTYIAFGLLGYCFSNGGSSSLECQLDYGSGEFMFKLIKNEHKHGANDCYC